MSQKRQQFDMSNLKLKKRHKWFSAGHREVEEGWYGPHKTVESAVLEYAGHEGSSEPIFVAQGRRTLKSEREEMGVEFAWFVDTNSAFEVRL